MIVTGGFSPNDAGELSPHRAQMSTREDVERHKPVPRAVHDAGGRIVLQLLHSGRYGYHPNIVAPSPIKAGINLNTGVNGIGASVNKFANCLGMGWECKWIGRW